MDTTTSLTFLILMVGSFALLLVLLGSVLHIAERLSPRFSRYLDRHVGPETPWERDR